MKNQYLQKLCIFSAMALGALLCGCSKSDNHEGHDHGEGGHGNGTGHTAMSNGVKMCTEHDVPEAQCAVCKPELAAKLQPGESAQLRLPSTNSAAMAGIQTALPVSGSIAEGIECTAEISYNQNQLAQIAAPVSGTVHSVEVDLGAAVNHQQTVAKIWSASIAEAVAKAVLSHQILERERKLRADRVTSQASLDEAEAAHRGACQQLRTLGFTEAQIDELSLQPQAPVLLEVRAPFTGEIVERTAVTGALVEAGKPLFTVANRTTVWAMLNVPELELGQVQTGQEVALTIPSLPNQTFTGKLTWIGPAVDERTRMTRARAEFSNPHGLLKDKMFAQARILVRQSQAAIVIPTTAVQYLEGKPLVFVKRGEDLFEARAVLLGAKHLGRQEVRSGLHADEPIAVDHVFALKSAMLMSRLGAGCADD